MIISSIIIDYIITICVSGNIMIVIIPESGRTAEVVDILLRHVTKPKSMAPPLERPADFPTRIWVSGALT